MKENPSQTPKTTEENSFPSQEFSPHHGIKKADELVSNWQDFHNKNNTRKEVERAYDIAIRAQNLASAAKSVASEQTLSDSIAKIEAMQKDAKALLQGIIMLGGKVSSSTSQKANITKNIVSRTELLIAQLKERAEPMQSGLTAADFEAKAADLNAANLQAKQKQPTQNLSKSNLNLAFKNNAQNAYDLAVKARELAQKAADLEEGEDEFYALLQEARQCHEAAQTAIRRVLNTNIFSPNEKQLATQASVISSQVSTQLGWLDKNRSQTAWEENSQLIREAEFSSGLTSFLKAAYKQADLIRNSQPTQEDFGAQIQRASVSELASLAMEKKGSVVPKEAVVEAVVQPQTQTPRTAEQKVVKNEELSEAVLENLNWLAKNQKTAPREQKSAIEENEELSQKLEAWLNKNRAQNAPLQDAQSVARADESQEASKPQEQGEPQTSREFWIEEITPEAAAGEERAAFNQSEEDAAQEASKNAAQRMLAEVFAWQTQQNVKKANAQNGQSVSEVMASFEPRAPQDEQGETLELKFSQNLTQNELNEAALNAEAVTNISWQKPQTHSVDSAGDLSKSNLVLTNEREAADERETTSCAQESQEAFGQDESHKAWQQEDGAADFEVAQKTAASETERDSRAEADEFAEVARSVAVGEAANTAASEVRENSHDSASRTAQTAISEVGSTASEVGSNEVENSASQTQSEQIPLQNASATAQTPASHEAKSPRHHASHKRSIFTLFFINLFSSQNFSHFKGALSGILLIVAFGVFVELFEAFDTNSIALLADATQFLAHGVALVFSAIAINITKKSAGKFGYYKIFPMTAILFGGFFAVVSFLGCIEAALRLVEPVEVDFAWAMFWACVGLLVKILVAFMLRQRSDIFTRISLAHNVSDTIVSLLVIFAAAVSLVGRVIWLENVVAIGIFAVMLKWSLTFCFTAFKFRKQYLQSVARIKEFLSKEELVASTKSVEIEEIGGGQFSQISLTFAPQASEEDKTALQNEIRKKFNLKRVLFVC